MTVDDILQANNRRAQQELTDVLRDIKRLQRFLSDFEGPTVTTLLEVLTAQLRLTQQFGDDWWQQTSARIRRELGYEE